MDNPYSPPPVTNTPIVAQGMDSRAVFFTRTYAHLIAGILAFAGIEFALFTSGAAESMARAMLGTNWLFVLGAFVVVSWIASRVAHSVESLPLQYLAYAGLIVAQAVIFVPMLFIAQASAPGAIQGAAVATGVLFLALTAVVFITRKDFSFMRGALVFLGFAALGLIVAAVLFGFQLGIWFSAGMVAFAGLAVLYDTSNVLHHFEEDRYVAAAMELFASIALMFWYILRLFLSRD